MQAMHKSLQYMLAISCNVSYSCDLLIETQIQESFLICGGRGKNKTKSPTGNQSTPPPTPPTNLKHMLKSHLSQ